MATYRTKQQLAYALPIFKLCLNPGPPVLVLLCVVQLHNANLGIVPGGPVLHRPSTVTAAMRSAEHVAPQRGFVFAGHCGRELVLQADRLHVLQVIQAVNMNSSAAVVVLGGESELALAVLELQALKVVDHGLDLTILCSQDVILPAVVFPFLVGAAVEAPVQLGEDVGGVQGLQACRLHATTAALRHLIKDKGVVWKAGLPGRHGLEERRKAALALHVDEGLMLGLPVER